ncbi:MAG: tyrosine-type recombinase/integrase [Christensenellales bacterium]
MEKDEKAGFKPSNHCIYWVFRFVVIIPYGHSHASLLANEGINIQEIARRLGHSNIEITWNTYSHLYPREEERAVKVLEKSCKERVSKKKRKEKLL